MSRYKKKNRISRTGTRKHVFCYAVDGEKKKEAFTIRKNVLTFYFWSDFRIRNTLLAGFARDEQAERKTDPTRVSPSTNSVPLRSVPGRSFIINRGVVSAVKKKKTIRRNRTRRDSYGRNVF